MRNITLTFLLSITLSGCRYYETIVQEIKEDALSLDVQATDTLTKAVHINLVTNKNADILYRLEKGSGQIVVGSDTISDQTYQFQIKKGSNTIYYVPQSLMSAKLSFLATYKEDTVAKELNILAQDIDHGWYIDSSVSLRRVNLYTYTQVIFTITGNQEKYSYQIETEGNLLVRLTGYTYSREGNLKPGIDYETEKNSSGIYNLHTYCFPLAVGPHSITLVVTDDLGNTQRKKVLLSALETEIDNQLKFEITDIDGSPASSVTDPYIYHYIDPQAVTPNKKALVYGVRLQQFGSKIGYIPEDEYILTIQPEEDAGFPADMFKYSINENLTLDGSTIDYDTYSYSKDADRKNAITLEVLRPERFSDMNEKIKIKITLQSKTSGKKFVFYQTLRVNIKRKTPSYGKN